MNENVIALDEREPKAKLITPLKLLTGGKGSGEDWLDKLTIGTVFLTRRKDDKHSFHFEEFRIIAKTKRSILLYTDLNQEAWVRADSKRFSEQWDLVEVLDE